MYYPTFQNIELIIKQMNKRYNMDVVITNKGQLEFALQKPMMKLSGTKLYPELYQKAAVLMETITKLHTLSDGNKRTAMMTAEFMIKANGGELVLPLKTIRLSVNTAMDSTDSMSELIQKWFKLHTAMNTNQLCFMLIESIEEESIIKKLWESKKFSEVEKLLSKWMAFDSYPEHMKAWNELGKQWKEYEESIETKSLSKKPNELTWPKMWGSIVSMAKGEEHRYSENLEMNVEKIEDLLYNDNTMSELDKIESIATEQEELFATTNDPDIIHQNGMVLVLHGNIHDSLNLFKKLYQLVDDKTDSLFHIGLIYDQLEDYENAIKSWQESLTIKTDNLILNYVCEAFISLDKFEEGLSYINKIPQEKLETRYSISKAICLKNLGDVAGALEIFEKLLSDEPENLQVNSLLGNTYFEKQDFKKALDRVNKAIELAPNSHDEYYNKALVLGGLQQFDEAMVLYDKALAINPKHDESWINKGALISNQGNYDEAITYLMKGLEINPENLIGLESMGITLCKMNKNTEALRYYDIVLKIDPKNPNAFYGKSVVCARDGDILECLSNLEKVITIDSKFKEIAKSDDDFKDIQDSEKFKQLTN